MSETNRLELRRIVADSVLGIEQAKAILVNLHTGADARPVREVLSERHNAVYRAALLLNSVKFDLEGTVIKLKEEIMALAEGGE